MCSLWENLNTFVGVESFYWFPKIKNGGNSIPADMPILEAPNFLKIRWTVKKLQAETVPQTLTLLGALEVFNCMWARLF